MSSAAKSRFARALVAIKDWCRTNRHWPVLTQHAKLSSKMRGHYAYYGITGNIQQLQRYAQQVTRTWRKWLAPRTRSRRFPWDRFSAFLARHPLPRAKIIHRYAT
jgi:RNA-directed DNA polymerase